MSRKVTIQESLERAEIGESGCWYLPGVYSPNYRTREIWEFVHKRKLGRWTVRHTCDHDRCINPKHLKRGTQKQNLQDCIKRGRFNKPRGEDHFRAELTEAKVIKIRKLYATKTAKELATQFDTSMKNIYSIVYRESWRHVK